MAYNIHPIFVHFPIAFLLLYSIIKIVPFKKWLPTMSWKDIERVLLLVGVVGAYIASSTGEIAEQLVRPSHQLLETHALFAGITTWLYGALLLGELLVLLTPFLSRKFTTPKIIALLISIQMFLTHRTVAVALALLGLVALSVTGLLGGVMVYGTSADPLAGIVLKLLGLTY